MIRRSFRGALCALLLLPVLTACPPTCEKPTVGRTVFTIPLGGSLTLTAGDVFNGVCGPDCVKSFTIGSPPSFLNAQDGNDQIVVDARNMSKDDADGVRLAGRLRDSMSVTVNTKCGQMSADLTINIVAPPASISKGPSGPQILPAGTVVTGPTVMAPTGGGPTSPVSFTMDAAEHF